MSTRKERFFESRDEAFSALLRGERERKGLTQEELADAVSRAGYDFHQQTVYKIESGRRKVSVGEALAIATVLGVGIEALTNRAPDSPESLSREVQRMGRDFAESLFTMWDQCAHVLTQRTLFTSAVRAYAKRLREEGDDSADRVEETLSALAFFSGPSDYSKSWAELLERNEARAALVSLGWDPDDRDSHYESA